MVSQRRRIAEFIGLLWVATAVIFVTSLPLPSSLGWVDFVVFFTLATLSERWYVDISDNSGMSLSFTVHFAAAVLFGPAFAILGAVFGLVVADGIIRRPPLTRTAFNIGQVAVSVGLCGLAYQALDVAGPVDLIADAPALAVGALVYLVVNDTLVAAVVSLTGHSFVREWRMSVKDLLLPYVSMAPLGALAAFAYQTNPWTLLYFVPLVLVIYEGFKLFVSLQRETDDALVALADSIDRRDKYTYQHSMRVAALVRSTADKLGLTPREAELVVAAARVHDLGKIATDNRVLYKPTALTQEERRMIQQHATDGEELAGRFSMFAQGRSFIRHHHERWDGTGYPDGLAGEAIPLGARIINVADSFDAMTTERPYRKARSTEGAVKELRHCAGTQFDPTVVQAFLEVLEGDWTPVGETQQQLGSWPPEDIVAELAEGRDPGQLWAAAGFTLCRLIDAPNCDLFRLDEDGDLVCVASICEGEWNAEDLGKRADRSQRSIRREVIKSRTPAVVASPNDPRLTEVDRAQLLRWDERAKILVPLTVRDEAIGLMEAGENRPGRTLTTGTVETASSLCELIAIAIHDAEVIDDQRLQARRLASLLESSRSVAGAESAEEALTVVTRRALELFGVTTCIAYEHEEELDALVPRAVAELTPSGMIRLDEPIALDALPAERDLLEFGGVRVECLSDPDLDPVSKQMMDARGGKSRLLVPMPSVDGSMGLLALWDATQERRYSDDELALATSLAELAGEAVRSAKLLRRLRGLSETDPLTGLANRRKIHELLGRVQAQAQRYDGHFSLAMIDLDGFKQLNDTQGHPAGDAVLKQVADVLREQTRAADIVGRYGGDEFMLVLPETGPTEAAALADKLRAAIADRPYVSPDGDRIPIRTSFGVAAYPRDARDVNDLIAVADSHLYASKRGGGDAVTVAGQATAADGNGNGQAARAGADAGGSVDLAADGDEATDLALVTPRPD